MEGTTIISEEIKTL